MNREKELLLRMAGSITVIVLCLAAMGFSAFAYFSHSISSGVNVIQAAHFDVVVTLVEDAASAGGTEDTDDEGVNDAASPAGEGASGSEASDTGTVESNGTVLSGNRLENCEARIYTFTIEASGDAQTGYCKIVIGKTGAGGQVYYTTQLFRQPDAAVGQVKALTISIDMTEGQGYTIEFVPQWGTSGHYAEAQDVLTGGEGASEIVFIPIAALEDAAEDDSAAAENGNAAETDTGEVTYTIKEGDTLFSIAQQYGIADWKVLAAYNGIDDQYTIQPGQVLKIPQGVEQTETSAESVTEVEETVE